MTVTIEIATCSICGLEEENRLGDSRESSEINWAREGDLVICKDCYYTRLHEEYLFDEVALPSPERPEDFGFIYS